MMFVYYYFIIPFHPQYLPRHAPSNIGKWRDPRWRDQVTQNAPLSSTLTILGLTHKHY